MAGNSKNALAPIRFINAQTMAADVTSNPINIQYLDNISIQLNFTGTPTGTFDLQGSLDYSPGPFANTGNWISVTLPVAPVAAGAASQILLDLNQLSFPWVKIVYTRSSGTGTLNGYISGKAI